MKLTPWCLVFLALFLTGAAALAQPQTVSPISHLADYDAELRRADGRVDVPAMVQRLQELGVTTYYWLIWHASTDWEDLQRFLPEAARAHIAVWVYLVPPSEGPPNGYPASEPFKLDYVRWGEEIARLSLQQTNLTGWVIDDFYANHSVFTPAYVGRMRAKAKAINPGLVFLPLMYFHEITPAFVSDYSNVIDGVVVAYPQDRDEIAEARAVLNGQSQTSPGQFTCPWDTPTHAGDYASASTTATVVSTKKILLRFRERDDFAAATSGYHFKQLLADDTVLWEQDVAGGLKGWNDVTVDATPQLGGKDKVTLTFRLLDKKGVSNFGVRWRVKDLRADGLQVAASLADPAGWKVDVHGPFEAGFGSAAVRHEQTSAHVPFIVMTAGSAGEFRQRHGDPASPERIAEWLRMCLDCRREGLCDGVVTYCLDKRSDSAVFPLARKLFLEAGRSK